MARSFTAASSHRLTHTTAVVTASPFTIAAWFNPASLHAGVICGVSTLSSDDNRFQLNTTAGANLLATSTTTVSTNSQTGSYTTSTWQHGAAVFASTTSRTVYLAGVAGTTDTTSNSPSSPNRSTIGCRYGSSGFTAFFDGLIAETAIWSVALTSSELLLLSKGYSPLLVRPASLVAYWPLTGRVSAEPDPVGKFDLTVTGATQAAHPRIIYPSSRVIVPVAAAAAAASTHHKHLPLLGAA